MAVMAQCPICKQRQKLANKICRCGEDLNQAKRSRRTRYWITYRVPGSRKKFWQLIGASLKEAQDADSKRRVQRREGRIFDMVPMADSTFSELFAWYMGLESVRALAWFKALQTHESIFCSIFGTRRANSLKKSDLDNFQAKLKAAGYSSAYIDQVVATARTVVNRAFEDEMLPGDCLRPFRRSRRLLKRGANARSIVLAHPQYERLMAVLPAHLAPVFAAGYWTGMRLGEILGLTWDRVDLQGRTILLEAAHTKTERARRVPIFEPLLDILRKIPRGIRTAHVFTYAGRPLRDISAGLRTAGAAAKIPYGRKVPGGWTFHDLRHTFITNMRRAGVPRNVRMTVSGHASAEMHDRYDTVNQDDIESAQRALVDHLAATNGYPNGYPNNDKLLK